MEPQTPQSGVHPSTNPLLAHLNDTEESHASTRVDFAHPGTIVHPQVNPPVEPDSTHHLSVEDSAPAVTTLASASAPSAAAAPATPAPAAPAVPMAPAAPAMAPEPESEPEPTIALAAKAKTPPAEAPPPEPPQPAAAPPAPKSPRNNRPIVVALIIILILGALGGGAYWWFKIRKPNTPANQPVNTQTVTVEPQVPTDLSQKAASGQSLTTGGGSKSPVELDFSMSTSANSGTLQPQVEVQPIGTPFTGQSNYHGADVGVTAGKVQGVVAVNDLKDGAYHWQARFVAGTTAGTWASFGGNDEATADFTIDSTAPVAASVSAVAGKSVKAGTTTVAITSNTPTITGKAEPGTTVALAISPDNQTATATTDSNGNWSVTLQQQLANGAHTLAITTTDVAGNTSSSSLTLNVNVATTATTTVAPTGDNTLPLTLLGTVLLLLAAGGLMVALRRGQPQV